MYLMYFAILVGNRWKRDVRWKSFFSSLDYTHYDTYIWWVNRMNFDLELLDQHHSPGSKHDSGSEETTREVGERCLMRENRSWHLDMIFFGHIGGNYGNFALNPWGGKTRTSLPGRFGGHGSFFSLFSHPWDDNGVFVDKQIHMTHMTAKHYRCENMLGYIPICCLECAQDSCFRLSIISLFASPGGWVESIKSDCVETAHGSKFTSQLGRFSIPLGSSDQVVWAPKLDPVRHDDRCVICVAQAAVVAKPARSGVSSETGLKGPDSHHYEPT